MTPEEKQEIRGVIARFTEGAPMIVSSSVWKILEKEGLVPDPRVLLWTDK